MWLSLYDCLSICPSFLAVFIVSFGLSSISLEHYALMTFCLPLSLSLLLHFSILLPCMLCETLSVQERPVVLDAVLWYVV